MLWGEVLVLLDGLEEKGFSHDKSNASTEQTIRLKKITNISLPLEDSLI